MLLRGLLCVCESWDELLQHRTPALLCASWDAASCAAQHPGSPGGELWQLVKKAPEKKNVRKAMQKFIFYFNSKI